MNKLQIQTISILLVAAFIIPNFTFAATNAGLTPKSPFYFLDALSEKIDLVFTFNPGKKAEKILNNAEERLAEAEVLADNDDDSETVADLVKTYQENVKSAKEKTDEIKDEVMAEGVLNLIAKNVEKNQEVLVIVQTKVPDEVKNIIAEVMQFSEQVRKDALDQISVLKQEIKELKEEVEKLKKEQEEKELESAKKLEKLKKELEISKIKPTAPKNDNSNSAPVVPATPEQPATLAQPVTPVQPAVPVPSSLGQGTTTITMALATPATPTVPPTPAQPATPAQPTPGIGTPAIPATPATPTIPATPATPPPITPPTPPTPEPTPPPTPEPVDITKGLVGYWKFDEESGITAKDSSVYNNPGSLKNGPTWATGKSGTALSFDGIDDYVDVGDPAVLNINDNLTISLWYQADTEQIGMLVNKFDNGSPDKGYYLAVGSGFSASSKLTMRVNDGTGNVGVGKDELTTTSGFTNGAWHHVVAIYKSDGTSRPEIYVDNIKQAGAFAGSAITSIATTPGIYFRIGKYSPDLGNHGFYFKGLIDEVRVYNRAVNISEINELYSKALIAPATPTLAPAPAPSPEPAPVPTSTTAPAPEAILVPNGLIGYWKFDETNGAVAADSSGNNPGALINGPTWVTGKLGTALSFDGIDDYVEIPHSNSLDIGGADSSFAISFWYKRSGTPLSWAEIIGKNDGSGRYPFGVRVLANGKIEFIAYGGSVPYPSVVSNKSVTDGSWHLITVIRDSATNQLRIYFDGSEEGVVADTTSVISNSDAIWIARGEGIRDSGTLDDLRIYNRTLSASEVSQLSSAIGN